MDYVGRFKSNIARLNAINPNIMVFITYGLFYDVFLSMYKPFATKFLERIGGTEYHIALYNSLPGLVAALVLLPGCIFVSRRREKKKITTIFFLVSRFLVLLLAFVPALPKEMQPILFIIFVSTMNFPEAVAQTSLQGFLGNVFDGKIRASAITLRNKFGNVAVPIATLITGLIIGIFPKSDAERIIYYQVFYVLAFVIGLFEIRTFRKFKEVPQERKDHARVGFKELKRIFMEPKFLRFLSITLIFQFVWQAGWPLTTIYQIKTLQANEVWLAVFAIGAGVASFFSAGFWSKLIQHKGNDYALVFAVFCVAINMFAFGFSPSLPIMFFAAVYSGFAVIGITSTMLNGIIGASPNDGNRVIAIGMYNTCTNLTLFISPFVSNYILEQVGIVNAIIIVGALRTLVAVMMLLDYKKQKGLGLTT